MPTRKHDTEDSADAGKGTADEAPKSPEFKDQTGGEPGVLDPDAAKQAKDKGYIGQTPDDLDSNTR